MLSSRLLIICFFGFFFGCQNIYGQSNTDPYKNRVIAKYYTTQELNFLENNNREKFNKIKYYFIYSFSVSPYATSNAQVFNFSLVDVKEFEVYRLRNQSVTVIDSIRGFKITLMSQRQLEKMNQTNVIPSDGDIKNSGFEKSGMILNPYFILPVKGHLMFNKHRPNPLKLK